MRDVFLWREMPDFERLKPHPANAAYREPFYRRWGIENCIVCGTGRTAEYTPFRQRLSVKLARGGRERYFVDGRSIAVDDDSFLILNDNRIYGSRFESNADLESFSIFFRPGMAEEVLGAVLTPIERALADGGEAPERPVEFVEALQPHDSIVSPVLRYIQYGVSSGIDDGDWYEEQFQFLLERMLAHHRRITEQWSGCPRSSPRRGAKSCGAWAWRWTSCTRATSRRSTSRRWRGRPACRSSTSCGSSPSCTASRRMPTCSASARLPRRGCSRLQLDRLPRRQRVGFNSRSTMARQMRRWSLD